MSVNKKSLSLKITAVVIPVLVLGVFFYLFYFKLRQEKKEIELQKANLEELQKEASSELYLGEKLIEELTEEEREYKKAELAYQSCFDKTEELNKDVKGESTNKYRIEWGGDSQSGWEFRFIKWFIEKYPEVCEEYDLDKIRYFLSKQEETSEDNTTQEGSYEGLTTQEDVEAIIEERVNDAIAENEAEKENEAKAEECKKKLKSAKGNIEDSEDDIERERKRKEEQCNNDKACEDAFDDNIEKYKNDLEQAEEYLEEIKEKCEDYL